MEGSVLDSKYQLVRLVGGGGMGTVYESVHIGTGRRVAVKVVKTRGDGSDAVLVKRFQREARAAGAIESRHIGQVLDLGRDEATGLPYMVMEYLKGEDVEALTRRVGPLSPHVALRIAGQACRGLARAHAAGIVHRDIKPANIFLATSEGDEVTVKVLDFGIAKMRADLAVSAETASLTRTGSMVGSPIYMSPEQARGHKDVDERADLWSLGVVMFQTMTGRTPWDQIQHLGELILAICSSLPPMVQDYAPWVPREVAAVVHRAISLDIEQRYQTADEMLAAITAVVSEDLALRTSMLVPVDTEARSQVAPRLALASSGQGDAPAPEPAAGEGAPRAQLTRTVAVVTPASSSSGVTQDGLASSSSDERRGRLGLVAGGLAASAVVGGLIALALGMTEPSSDEPSPVAQEPSGESHAGVVAPPAITPDVEVVEAPPPEASASPAASGPDAALVDPDGGALVPPAPKAPTGPPSQPAGPAEPHPKPPKDPGGLDTSGFGDRK